MSLFRWLKSLLQLDHFISRDPTGIIRQLVVALVVWGLLMLFNQSQTFSPKQLWRELQAAMHQAIFEFGRRGQQAGVSWPPLRNGLPSHYRLEGNRPRARRRQNDRRCCRGCSLLS